MNTTSGRSEWPELGLLDLVTIKSGQVDPRSSKYRNLPLIAPDHISQGTGRLIDKKSAAAQKAISGKYLVKPGDVIYSKIRPYLQKAYKCDFEALCSADMYPLTPKSGVDASFVLHIVLGRDFTNFATSVSVRSGIPKINREELAEYRFATPSPDEQRGIGQVLDDADSLIAALELRIAKKQRIKQGMMQQLLTGRRRFPGFTMPWSTVRLGAISTFITKGSTPTTYGFKWQSTGVPFLRSECVSEHGLDMAQSMFISTAANQSLKRSRVTDGDILMTITGNVGRVVRLSGLGDANINQHIARVRINDRQFDDRFVYYYLSQRVMRDYYESIVTGQAYPQISLKQVRETEIPAPQIEEQGSIASALGDLDSELTSLRARLAKARAMKIGMMQHLLTGRTRLPMEALS